MPKQTPTTADVLTCAPTVPVDMAAAYLGMSPQSLREGVKAGDLKIGAVVKRRIYIYPNKLIALKEGKEGADKLTNDANVIFKLLETRVLNIDDIWELVAKKQAEGTS